MTGITLYSFLPALFAQQEQSLHFLTNVWQSNLTNPAIKSSDKFQIILPSVYYNIHTPDFTINDLFRTDEFGNLNMSEVARNRIKQRNRINAQANILSLGISYPVSKKISLSIYQSINSHASVDLDGDMLKMILVDNIDYVGKLTKLTSSGGGSSYSEIGVGGNYAINDKVQIGTRIKMYKGIAAAFAIAAESRVFLENTDYAMSMNNNVNIVTYSLTQLKDIDGVGGALNSSFAGSNRGYGFDFGTTVSMGKWRMALSFIDVGGFIRWRDEGTRYSSLGDRHFKGIKTATISIDRIPSSNSGIKDNIKDALKVDETPNPWFLERIPTKYYFSSSYEISPKLMVGGLIFQEASRYTGVHKGFSFNTTYKLMKSLQLGGSLGLRNGSFTNLGMHIVTQLGPVQMFGVTDNIISSFRAYNTHSANGRVGLNILLN